MDSEEKALRDFLQRMVDRLRRARGESAQIEAAIRLYLEEGDALEMSPLELRDYFDISFPGLAEEAGYGESEQDEASRLFDVVSEERYGGASN